MRPQMVAFYEDANIVIQTAVLIEGVAMAHSFIDGNKRTALLAGITFLDINGYALRDAHNVIGKQIEELVVTRNTKQFREWLQSHIQTV
jgi:death-on-curing protein